MKPKPMGVEEERKTNNPTTAEMDALEGSPEDWIQELQQAGWTKHSSSAWMSPGGILFMGPALALKKKRAHPELFYLTMEDLQVLKKD